MINGLTQDEIKAIETTIRLMNRILNSENTVSVSNDGDESGVLHGVGESHRSEPTDKANQSFVDGTLERITDSESDCAHNEMWVTKHNIIYCRCGEQMGKVTKGS